MGLFNALRGGGKGQTDAMRQTTTLTMAYLLEQNRQFEAYMREKVEELEARVAAQQARASVKIDGVDEATRPMTPDAVLDRTQPAAPPGEVDDDILSFFSADFELDEAEDNAAVAPSGEPAAEVEAEAQPGVKAEETAPPEWVDWEATLLGSPVTAAAAPVESGGAAGTPAAEDATETTTTALEADEPIEPANEAAELSDSFLPSWLQAQVAEQPVAEAETKGKTEVEANTAHEVGSTPTDEDNMTEETEVTLPLADGPVEDWA